MRKRCVLAFGLLLLLLSSGCTLRSPEELYTLPEPPEEYQNLNALIQETMTALGAEYAPPMSGSNTQTVQLVDLDGDGVDEAVAFFRVTGDPKPLKIYFYKKNEEGLYHVHTTIEGDGTAIQSVAYENLGGSTGTEVVVSWRMSDKVHALVSYDFNANGVTELMRTGYRDFRILDIDMDREQEILVLQLDLSRGQNRVELYDYRENGMVLSASAPMSYDVRELALVRTGSLRGGVKALFVSSFFGEANGLITDVFAWKNGAFANVTLDPVTGQSQDTIQYYNLVSSTDINGDGVLELPAPSILPASQKSPAADFWTIHWRQFDAEGRVYPVCTTYHNLQDRWYLVLPEDWMGQLTLSRRDNAVNGERAVVFSHWMGSETEPTPFLTIYKLTGINRVTRSHLGKRFVLSTQSDAIFAAEFHENSWDCGLDPETLTAGFHLIRSEWSMEN